MSQPTALDDYQAWSCMVAIAPTAHAIPTWAEPASISTLATSIIAPTAHAIPAWAKPASISTLATSVIAPTAHAIPAWGEAPCTAIRISFPQVAFVAFHSIFLEECAEFLLKILLSMMHFLGIDVMDQGIQVRWPNGERAIASLPRELRQGGRLRLEPFRGGAFEVLHQLRHGRHAGQANGEMNVIRDASYAIAFTFGVASDGGKIGVKRGTHRSVENGCAVFCAEDHMDKDKRERSWHRSDYRSGFQPSYALGNGTWGFALCWYVAAPSALS